MPRPPVYVPCVNRPDLLARAVASLPPGRAVVIDATPDGLPADAVAIADRVHRWEGDHRFTLIQNWIQQDAYAGGHGRFYFLHSDATASPGGLDAMESTADELDAAGTRWGVVFTVYDALVMFNAVATRDVGPWDESFGWYVADIDYYNRLRWAGWGHFAVPSALALHDGSATLHALPGREQARVKADQEWAVRHYVHKWGCHFHEGDGRRHKTPFGR